MSAGVLPKGQAVELAAALGHLVDGCGIDAVACALATAPAPFTTVDAVTAHVYDNIGRASVAAAVANARREELVAVLDHADAVARNERATHLRVIGRDETRSWHQDAG